MSQRPLWAASVIYFFVGSVLFTAIPLLSWGILDWMEYLADPGRSLYTVMMILATLLVVLFVPNQGRGVGEGAKVVKRQRLAILYLQIVSTLVLVVSPISDRWNILAFADGNAVRYAGLALTAAGYFMMNWSILVLGKQFSLNVTIQENHELVTTGPYRLIRHPRYLGILGFLSGISLVFRSLLSIGLVAVTLLVILWRIRDEEALMRSEFGERWSNYAAKTRRLIPFVY